MTCELVKQVNEEIALIILGGEAEKWRRFIGICCLYRVGESSR
jgi:hypothetical protein